MNSGVAHRPLNVLDEKREPLPYVEIPSQIAVGKAELAPGSSAVLADNIDIGQNYPMIKPGKYFVQFNGMTLDIGERLPRQEIGPFGENDVLGIFDFLPTSTKFPSNSIEIEVIDVRME